MLQRVDALYKKLRTMNNGARYYKVDLHTHSPVSNCFDPSQKSLSPEIYVRAAIDKGFDALAITDHNTIDYFIALQEASNGTGLTIFPGVEISTPGGHILAIFDPSYDITLIDEMLIRIGLSKSIRGNQETVTNKSALEVIKEIESCQGVAIAAHVYGEKGLFSSITDGGTRKSVYNNPCLRGVQVSTIEEKDILLNGRKDGYIQKACIFGSDCMIQGNPYHCIEGLGSSYVYIKMDRINIEGVRQALFDPEVRIKFPSEYSPVDYPHILGLYVDQKFLKDAFYKFNPNLNCFIGGKGVGKSLSFELIRYALKQQSNIKEISLEYQSLLEQEFGQGGNVFLFVLKDSQVYCIVRSYPSDDSQIFRCNEAAIEQIENIADLSSFFKIKAFSQSEIISIARQPTAQLPLIDDLIDTSEDNEGIRVIINRLNENSSNLESIITEIINGEEKLQNIGIIKENIKNLEATIKDPRLKNHQNWHEEERAIDNLELQFIKIRESFETYIADILSSIKTISLVDEIPNVGLLKDMKASYELLPAIIDEINNNFHARYFEIFKVFNENKSKWRLLFNKEEEQNQSLLESLGAEGYEQIESRLNELKKQLDQLESLKKQIETVLKINRNELETNRNALLDSLQQHRRRLFALRNNKAREITSKLENNIKVRMHHAKNRVVYNDELINILKGSRVHSPDISAISNKVHPIRLSKVILERNVEGLSSLADITESVSQRIIEFMLTKYSIKELLDIQTINIEDQIEIMFRLSGNNYKSIQSLSHGGKCMVVLNIAMVEGNFPLLVDQPEDALDSSFIYEYVVTTLRLQKELRQFILTTHNANILVSSDTEQIFVLDATDELSTLRCTGSIDCFDTRDLVLLNLEGGEIAFDLRRKKYGLLRFIPETQGFKETSKK